MTGVFRTEGAAVVIRTAQQDIRVDGDAAFVTAVLERCDGRTSVEQIAAPLGANARDDVTRLVGLLAERGAVVDCTRAYRIFHAQASAGSAFFGPVTEAELAELADATYHPVGDLGPPRPLRPPASTIADLTRRRASTSASQPGRSVSFEQLSGVLDAMYGGGRDARRVPSGGGLYPLILHLVITDGPDELEPGLWWYDARAGALRMQDPAARRDRLLLAHPLTDAIAAAGGPIVVLSADLERPAAKYASRGYRFALIEAGAALQNAHLVGAELGVPVRAVGGIDDAVAHELLGLGPDGFPLLAILLGR